MHDGKMTSQRRNVHRPNGCHDYNVVLLGMLGVGKSALTVKYLTRRFIMEYDPFLEDIYTKRDTIDGQDFNIRIMDTYEKVSTADGDSEKYIKWADAFLIVYSITNKQSFSEARNYLQTISQHGRDSPVALVGNKMDLERYRQISKSEGRALAVENECLFFETAASEDYEHVEKIFHGIVREIIRENERQLPLQSLFISEEKPCALSTAGGSNTLGRPSFRRAKSPKPEKEVNRTAQKKSSSSFRLFNKGFKIFN